MYVCGKDVNVFGVKKKMLCEKKNAFSVLGVLVREMCPHDSLCGWGPEMLQHKHEAARWSACRSQSGCCDLRFDRLCVLAKGLRIWLINTHERNTHWCNTHHTMPNVSFICCVSVPAG